MRDFANASSKRGTRDRRLLSGCLLLLWTSLLFAALPPSPRPRSALFSLAAPPVSLASASPLFAVVARLLAVLAYTTQHSFSLPITDEREEHPFDHVCTNPRKQLQAAQHAELIASSRPIASD